jgi:phage-related protein
MDGFFLKDLKGFPTQVQRNCGYALHLVQTGKLPPDAKPMKGIGGGKATMMEIVLDYDRDTYRAVYTAKLEGVIYVLHCFQKKSKRGIATPREELAVIKARLASARKRHYAKGDTDET